MSLEAAVAAGTAAHLPRGRRAAALLELAGRLGG